MILHRFLICLGAATSWCINIGHTCSLALVRSLSAMALDLYGYHAVFVGLRRRTIDEGHSNVQLAAAASYNASACVASTFETALKRVRCMGATTTSSFIAWICNAFTRVSNGIKAIGTELYRISSALGAGIVSAVCWPINMVKSFYRQVKAVYASMVASVRRAISTCCSTLTWAFWWPILKVKAGCQRIWDGIATATYAAVSAIRCMSMAVVSSWMAAVKCISQPLQQVSSITKTGWADTAANVNEARMLIEVVPEYIADEIAVHLAKQKGGSVVGQIADREVRASQVSLV